MKRKITRLETSRSRTAIIKAWIECWTKQLNQDRIQRWIERISRHIQQIIELDESNEYRENKKDDLIRSYDQEDRRTRYLKDKRDFINSDSDDNINDVDVNDVNDVNDDDDEWDEFLIR
jgi:hypothetical protein